MIVLNLKAGAETISRYEDQLVPSFLQEGVNILFIRSGDGLIPIEINPYLRQYEQLRIISGIGDCSAAFLEIESLERAKLELETADPLLRSGLSQLVSLNLCRLYRYSLAYLYSQLTEGKEKELQAAYGSGWTLVNCKNHSYRKKEIVRAMGMGLMQFKYRPPVGIQSSHGERLRKPPTVINRDVEMLYKEIIGYGMRPLIDLGGRLTGSSLTDGFVRLLEKHDLVEEPFPRNRNDVIKRDLTSLMISGGEHCNCFEAVDDYLSRNSFVRILQPDLNLISPVDVSKCLIGKNHSLYMHNWTTFISAYHNISFALSVNKSVVEYPVIENPMMSVGVPAYFKVEQGLISINRENLPIFPSIEDFLSILCDEIVYTFISSDII